MTFQKSSIPGVWLIKSSTPHDSRGRFQKTFHEDQFYDHGISFPIRETFFSASKRDVIRGMHLQTPPHEHDKLVSCVQGEALDVLVDVRSSSNTFGRFESYSLSESIGLSILIPKGVAHGFLSLVDDTILLYQVTTTHHPDSDGGVRFDSFGFAWPCQTPIISERDLGLPDLADFRRWD